eukprot:TRINITY_DN13553_c0_g1_i1.p1 TRINITY_DN13553_c0_g1~~TRINITY_DN13553_c0_g1_i1.p1  ORF type:complete len:964 (+),score=125.72 TRINITY_DN13553_c0_g1_i1:210-3101(+)
MVYPLRLVVVVQSAVTVLVSVLIGVLLMWSNMSKTLADRDEACDTGIQILLDETESKYIEITRQRMTDILHSLSREIWIKVSTPLTSIKQLSAISTSSLRNDSSIDLMPDFVRPLAYSLAKANLATGISEVSVYFMDQGIEGNSQFFTIFNNHDHSSDHSDDHTGDDPRDDHMEYITLEYYGPTEPVFTSGDYRVTVGSTDTVTGGVQHVPDVDGCYNLVSGVLPTGVCVLSRRDVGSEYLGSWFSDILLRAEFNEIGWLPAQTKSRLLTKTAFTAISTDGIPVMNTTNRSQITLIQVGIDLLSLSDDARIAVNDLPGSRLYGVEVAYNSVVAVSHGDAFTKITSDVNSLITPWDATDAVIAAHGSFMNDSELLQYSTMPSLSTWVWNSTEYWVHTEQITQGIPDSDTRFHIVLVLLVPIDANLKDARVTTQEALARVAFERDQVDKESAARRIPMWILLALCLVALSCFSFVTSIYLTKPIEVLSTNMEAVAEMQLDEIQVSTSPSFLAEVRTMQNSFISMFEALREYRSYLPLSVLCSDQGDQGDQTEQCDAIDETIPAFPTMFADMTVLSSKSSIHSFSKNRTSSSQLRESQKELKDIPNAEPSSRERKASSGAHGLQSGLVPRRSVVALTFQLKGFHEWVAHHHDSPGGLQTAVQSVSEWIAVVEAIISKQKGMILWTTLGDSEVTAVWGFYSRTPTGVNHAVDAALEIAKPASSKCPSLEAYCAVSESICFCGNLGSGKVRAPAIVGSQKSNNNRLVRVGMHFDMHCLVTDSKSLEAYEIMPVDCCKLHSVLSAGGLELYPSTPVVVFAVLRKPKQDGEWMYGLNELEQKLEPILRAYNEYARGNYAAATEEANKILQSGATEPEALRLLSLIPKSSPGDNSPLFPPFVVSDAEAGFGKIMQQQSLHSVRRIISPRDRYSTSEASSNGRSRTASSGPSITQLLPDQSEITCLPLVRPQ